MKTSYNISLSRLIITTCSVEIINCEHYKLSRRRRRLWKTLSKINNELFVFSQSYLITVKCVLGLSNILYSVHEFLRSFINSKSLRWCVPITSQRTFTVETIFLNEGTFKANWNIHQQITCQTSKLNLS